MADIINIEKLREAKEAADATERLHAVLCIAAKETATGALCREGRLQLLAAILPAFAPGPGWTVGLKYGKGEAS